MSNSGQIILPYGVAPGTPSSGKITIYPKADKILYYKDDDGVETALDTIGTLIELTDTPSGYDSGKYLKSTVDGTEWGTDGAGYDGQEEIGSGVDEFTVVLDPTTNDADYAPVLSLENTIDSPVSLYSYTIIDTTISGFTVKLSGVTDSANYVLNWKIGGTIVDAVDGVVDHGELTGLTDDDHTQYLLRTDTITASGTNYGSIITVSGTYAGETLTVTVDDSSSVVGSILTQAADFNYDRADADAAATAPGYCMALEAGAGSKAVFLRGQICDTAWSWSAGKLYLSGTTGEMTQTKPAGTGDQVQVLGWALSANTIFFDPVTMVVEVA